MTPNRAPEWLSVPAVCDQLGVARSSLYRWWELGTGPRRIKLPNGSLRVRSDWLEDWLLTREDAA